MNAETINPNERKLDICGRYEVFHVNGISTGLAAASANLLEISRAYGNAHDGHIISYFLAHNRSAGVFADLFQAWQQIVRDFPDITWELVVAAFNGLGQPLSPAQMAILQERLSQFQIIPPAVTDPDFVFVLNQVRASHQTNARMLIVGHSQGTLFSNELFDALAAGTGGGTPVSPSTMGLVLVAAVTANVRGAHSSHVTSQRDVVVNLVRAFVAPGTLAHSVTLPFMAADYLGHNLTAVYLTDPTAKGAIVGRMGATLSALISPVPSSSISPTYTFSANAAWADCGVGWMQRTYECWLGLYTYPINTFHTAGGSPSYTIAPGTEQDAFERARAHMDGCIAAAAAAWQTRVTTGTLASAYVTNCGWNYNLADSYAGYRSAEGVQQIPFEFRWPPTYRLAGNKAVRNQPVCTRT